MEESLRLNAEHQKALQQGESVPIVEKATRTSCVVVRADVFDRIKKLLPQAAYPALDEVMKEDWSNPKMAEYDDYESHRPSSICVPQGQTTCKVSRTLSSGGNS